MSDKEKSLLKIKNAIPEFEEQIASYAREFRKVGESNFDFYMQMFTHAIRMGMVNFVSALEESKDSKTVLKMKAEDFNNWLICYALGKMALRENELTTLIDGKEK